MSPARDLSELLTALFDPAELRRFVSEGPEGPEIRAGLPGATASSLDICESAVDQLERRGLIDYDLFDRLILVGQEQIRSTMEDRLDKQVRERLVGWTEVDMSAASEQDVREAVAPMIREHRLAREQEALERMVAGVAAESGHGVVGLAPTLQALNEYRVEILLLDPELHVPGGRCPQCEVLFIEGLRTCPADGEEIVELADVTRAAVAKALEQSADVLLSAPDPALADAGGIGAVTRF